VQTIFEWAQRNGVSNAALLELTGLLGVPRVLPKSAPTHYRSEEAVQSALQIAAPYRGCELWRNNSGACTDDKGRLIRYGLGNVSARVNENWKSSDLIGIFPRLITADMVGTVVGQFAAVECKEPGWKKPKNDHERAQARFLSSVAALGGFATFAQSPEDVFT
jgi:hypothetical protein